MDDTRKRTIKRLLLVSIILFIASTVISWPYLGSVLFPAHPLKGPVKLENTPGGSRLTVGGVPFFIKGVCYQYVPIGKGEGYDVFSDTRKPWMIDGRMMQQMGVNAVRFYRPGRDIGQTKTVVKDLNENFGIKSALGHYLGYWDWPPPNYADPAFTAKIKAEVLDMVRSFKDEDGILFWILGNENNYSFDRGERDWSTPEIDKMPALEARRAKAKIYYTFVNTLAREIKKIDPNHPVAMGNGELASITVAKDCCPDVDILGGIVYQGKSFGAYFERLKRSFGKPNVFIEFGSDAYDSVWQQESQDMQAFFLKMQWLEIYKNRAGSGSGNSLGGFIFEWSDEWWKHNTGYAPGWTKHDIEAGWANPAYYFDSKASANMNEEWWGVVSIDPKNPLKNGIEKRVPRKAFYVFKSLWAEKDAEQRMPFAFAAAFFLGLTALFALMGASRQT